MRATVAALGVALTLVASRAHAAPEPTRVLDGLAAERVVTGLRFPVALAATPDGTLLVTEKEGAIRVVRDGKLVTAPAATFSPIVRNEAGLLAVELAPDFEVSRRFYVTYTPQAFQDAIHVVRLELEGDTAKVLDDPWLALPSNAGTDRHYAANLKFGPRGELYVSLGELRNEADAQNPETLPGSLLRYEADLSIPADNPFPGSPVFAYGLRNPFGLEVAADGRIIVGDNGADVADELNLIEPGRNYGWPLVEGFCDHFPKREPCATPGLYADPIREFRQVVSPTGIVIYDGALMPERRGELWVGGFHSNAVHRFALGAGNGPVEPLGNLIEFSQEAGAYSGGIVDLEVAPDGALLVLMGGFKAGEIWRIAPAPKSSAKRVSAAEPNASPAPRTRGCSTAASAPAPEGRAAVYAWLLVASVTLQRSRRRSFR